MKEEEEKMELCFILGGIGMVEFYLVWGWW